MSGRLIASTAIGVLGLVSLAAAQYEGTPPRFVGTFTAGAPGHGTGFHEEIDYFDPQRPDDKPPSVDRIVIDLPEGTRIDTSVPEQCKASSSDFSQRGADACPPGSRIGGGEVEVDTGSPGGPLPRVIHNKLTLFNDEDTIILFTESTNTDPPIRNAGRSVAKDGQFISEAPDLPGFPPPDNYTAIRKVRLDIEPHGGYLTTPAECPRSGAWTTTGTFTYRSGAEYRLESQTPCRRAKKLRAKLVGVPRGCVRGGFRVRGRVLGGAQLGEVRVLLDGRTLFTSRKRVFVRRVPAGRLDPGRYRLRAVARDAAGARATVSRSFRRC